ncbi:MAG TPA: hypothetical protein DEQ43_18470 [Nocardioides bacterium]|uniref:ABC transporter substrate-binding protein n=1 Tax=uncultured Nocardioides sp. TaxID=198441 RepID=UPI000EE4AA14|nr:ABC transporter substrate-binding protein [uncultured Nocardioides sp.]HCB06191.1 hypothetical protein [Nocardioides sp.]HRD60134.1 ABC transporter substrate-binding protein [Nocardioides sp.]HRK44460.1 ABC transporter substrate-binding protein [Nocardioides sp.]
MDTRRLAGFIGVATLLVLSACGGGDDRSEGDPDASGSLDTANLANTGSRQDPDREGPKTIEGAEEGGTVTVLTSMGLRGSIDPTDNYATDTITLMAALVTRQLTQYSYDPDSGQMVLVPDLATDLGTPNDDYTEWAFTLRDGVRWESGDPVTADEVAFGIERSMDAQTFSEGPGLLYSTHFFLGGEEYGGPYSDPDGDQQAVSVDGDTITVKMARPFPDFPYYAAMPAMGPIPTDPAINDPAKYAQHPLSTGPYKIDQYTLGQSLVLVRNDQWDPETDPARTAYPDSYVFKSGQLPEQIDQLLLADSGDAKTTISYDDVLAQDYQKMDETGRLVTGGKPCTSYFAVDQRAVPDSSIAEALTWALPYDDLIVGTGLIPGVNAIPAENLMPPGIPGREEYNPVEGHGPFETDPEKAKQILADSGNEGFEIKFLFAPDIPPLVATKDVLVKGLEAAGFTVTPIAAASDDFAAQRLDVNNEVNLRPFGSCSDWPSGSTWIPIVFGSTDLDTVGFGYNFSAFSNPDVDARIEEISTLPVEDQPQAWNDLEQEIMTTYLPVVPGWYGGAAQMRGSQIEGFNIDTAQGRPTYRDIWINSD